MLKISPLQLFLLLFVISLCISGNGVYAFGAGNIPSFAYLEGKAFRHGDIEDILADLVKKGSTGFALASIVGGRKFNGLDVKRVYFGNWLRDYSQAVDIAALKKLEFQTILNLCMVLGFLANGYATNEFEVTKERLGCYLPVEHIDNPKGYGDGEDAKKYDSRLRGPVDPMELEVDPRTGMKNYIANENGHWDTSKALVRRLLDQCIQLGRRNRSSPNKSDEYESLRLLGTLLHTLEDFPAHSNFCELALVHLGYHDVFTHVGDHVRIQATNGKRVAPLVTGTFGGSDFMHSLLGEAGDHLSEASVTDLNREFEKARSQQQSTRGGPGGGNAVDLLRDALFKLPGIDEGGEMSRDLGNMERIRAGPAGGGKNPETMSPQELHATLWQILTFRDSVVKKISKTIEKIPGLGPLIDKLMESISIFIFTTLEPYVKPILKSATSGLQQASEGVINSHDQYEVFNDSRASDPTHSFLSKDHFNLILNEPAGLLAKTIVTHTVNLVVKAWDDTSLNVHQVAEDILGCLFHPDFHNPNLQVQRQMMQTMTDWINGKGNKKNDVVRRLTKNAVRNHENIRLAGEGGQAEAVGTAGYNQGIAAQQKLSGYLQNIPGVSQAQGVMNQFSGGSGQRRDAPGGHHTAPPTQPSSQSYGVPTTGEAAGFYRSSSEGYPPHSGPPPMSHHRTPSGGYQPPEVHPPHHGHNQMPSGGYQPPSGYPPHTSNYSPSASHSPFPPSSFPPQQSDFNMPPHPYEGYNPTYVAPPPQPPSFPGFPGGPGGYQPSYDSPHGPPGGPPSFPGGMPSFPGGPSYGNNPPPQFPQFPGGPPGPY